MDFRYPQGQWLIKKEDKDFRDFKKNKSSQNPLINISSSNKAQFSSIQLVKKN